MQFAEPKIFYTGICVNDTPHVILLDPIQMSQWYSMNCLCFWNLARQFIYNLVFQLKKLLRKLFEINCND